MGFGNYRINIIMGVENMMNKKGEMLARDWIFILVLFGAITAIGYLIVADMASSESGYNVTNMTDETFQDNYDTLSESTSTIYQMQNATTSEQGMSVLSTYTTMFTATFSIISLIFGSFGMASNTMTNFATDFGVPSILANIIFPAILVLIIVIIVFVIISSVSRGRL